MPLALTQEDFLVYDLISYFIFLISLKFHGPTIHQTFDIYGDGTYKRTFKIHKESQSPTQSHW